MTQKSTLPSWISLLITVLIFICGIGGTYTVAISKINVLETQMIEVQKDSERIREIQLDVRAIKARLEQGE